MNGEQALGRLSRSVRERARDACEYCLLPQAWQDSTFHLDHIHPRAKGGRNHFDNLALACVGCSLKKGVQIDAKDPQCGLRVRLFHPRLDRWFDHFGWDRRWRIVGKTSIGRATIQALELNRQRLLEIRQDMAKVERYPP